MTIIPVILSGGSGERLWPLSRKEYPKQYLKLVGENSTFQETLLHLIGIDKLERPIIVCNESQRFLVAEQCQQIDIDNPVILLEPVARNTAPAITAAAFQAAREFKDSILLVLSADHIIQDIASFHAAINIAVKEARAGALVTFGVTPLNANTGYGYIEYSKNNNKKAFKVDRFVEKPNLLNAESFLERGNFLWNSGIFLFKTSTFLEELSLYSNDIVNSARKSVANASSDFDFIRLEKQSFELSPSDSIDYALLEKSNKVVVVPINVGWHDIGSWSSLYDIGDKDENGNVLQGDIFAEETTNSLIYANHHMIVTIGLKNMVVVDTPNATLITTKDKDQKVKKILAYLKSQNREESLYNRKVYRPWGWYDVIEKGKNFQVKRIFVNPGAKLSLQSHKYRAEHWVVVDGDAIVTIGKDKFNLSVNQSTYVPEKEKHSLENNSTIDSLEIIEVQSGTYFGEDDIIRYEDIYNRHK
jgi:mannose-1-phosphate guanylyltransferase/mannose-6-phosphate isomerase